VGNIPPRWSSGEVKCSACSREEGTLQRLGELVSFLVCSADLGASDMSCLYLLLKIFVLDVDLLAQFCHAVSACDIDVSLVVDAQGNGVFCRPDQCSLTNRYVDNNSSLISE
jgi:hypothetical protein